MNRIYKLTFLLIFLFTIPTVFAQRALPMIRSTAKIIHISDGKEVLNGAWQLSPELKPDIYRTVNSTETRIVTFTTDIDSISFLVKPGEEYDLNIILNNTDTCFTRVSTLKGTKLISLTDSIFTRSPVSVALLLIIVLTLVLAWYYRDKFNYKKLLRLGFLIPFIFWLGTFIGAYIHGDYNHLTNIVSELGAIGTRSEIFMSTIELLMALLAVFYFIGLYKAAKDANISYIPLAPLLVFSIGIAGVSFYPLSNPLHAVYGSVMLPLIVSPLLAIFLWRGKGAKQIRILSGITLGILTLIFLRFIPSFQANYAGLVQRFFHFGWSLWFIFLSYYFITLANSSKDHPGKNNC